MSFRAYLDALEDMTGDSSNLIRPDGKAERALTCHERPLGPWHQRTTRR